MFHEYCKGDLARARAALERASKALDDGEAGSAEDSSRAAFRALCAVNDAAQNVTYLLHSAATAAGADIARTWPSLVTPTDAAAGVEVTP